MGLTRRHFAVSLTDKDGHLKCPGGGVEHKLGFEGRIFGEGHVTLCCSVCNQHVFLLQQKYGVVNIWEIEPGEVKVMEREGIDEPRKILEYLNRGAKRLDHT